MVAVDITAGGIFGGSQVIEKRDLEKAVRISSPSSRQRIIEKTMQYFIDIKVRNFDQGYFIWYN